MTVGELHTELVKKRLKTAYIFTGEELEVRSQYIHKIAEIAGGELVVRDTFAEVVPMLNNRSLIGGGKRCYLIWEDRDFLTADNAFKTAQERAGQNTVIFVYNNIDKRTKFYKQNKAEIVEFERLTPQVLAGYVQKRAYLSDKNTDKLIEVCECDYSRILLEIDKILNFRCVAEADGYDADCNEAFEMLLKGGVIYQPPKDAIFDFVDAVLMRDVRRIYSCLDDCKRIGEAILALISVLYTSTKQLLQVQSYVGKDIAKSTGLTAWQIKAAQARKGRYSNGELVRLMRNLRAAEIGIKTGGMEEEFAVDYLLLQTL